MATWDDTTTQTGDGHQTDAAPIPSHKAIADYLNEGDWVYLTFDGGLVTGTGVHHFVFPVAGRILGVTPRAATGPAGTGSDIFDIHNLTSVDVDNGSLWATTPANRPQVASGNKADSPIETAPDENNTFAAGSYFRVDVDAVATTAGQNYVLAIRYFAEA